MDVRGVDFSGSAAPGRDIWLADGRLDGDRLEVTACQPAAEPLKSTPRTSIRHLPAAVTKGRGIHYRLGPTAGHAQDA